MRAITKFLAGGVAITAVAAAAPAAAQYYPGYGYGNQYSGNVVGQVLNGVLGNGYGNYGANSQVAVNQCAAAVQGRLSGYNGYNNAYNNQAQVDLTWRCRVDYRGYVRSVDINRAQANYGYQGTYSGTYTPYNQDYSQYGYRRY